MKQQIFFILSLLSFAALHAESWQIGSIQYKIEGRTTEQAIERTLKIDRNRQFTSQQELTSYVDGLKKKLTSCRTFDSTAITETLSGPDSSGLITDSLVITVHDTRNVIAVPYPSYDSNTGFVLKLKLKDYNIAGSMAPLSASLYYAPDSDTFDSVIDKRIGGDITLVTPFEIGRKDAFLTTSGNACYVLNRNLVLFDAGTQFEYYPVTAGSLSWGPYISVTGSRNDAYEAGGYEAIASAGQKMTVQDITWNGNFRTGCDISIIQTFDYSFIDSKPFVSVTADAQEFKSFGHIGFTLRQYALYSSNDVQSRNMGEYLRGIRDKDIRSDMLFVCNFDMPFTLFTINFPKTSRLSLFNFEMQCSPFVDIALGHNEYTDSYFNPKDGLYSFGADFNVFPARWRSLQVHTSFGIDAVKLLQKLDGSAADGIVHTDWRTGPLYEISAGIGLFY